MKNFLTTIWGSYVKVLIVALLSVFLVEIKAGMNIFELNMETLGTLAGSMLVAVIPILINWFDPNDSRYGVKKGAGDFPTEAADIKD
jgi:hypothetical protein